MRHGRGAGRVHPGASRSGCGSPCSSPTSPRRWPRGAARPRPTRCARPARDVLAQAAGRRPRDRRRSSAVPGTDARARATSSSSKPGDVIPADGEVVEGVASVDESAITGESAPVIRESGGDRSAVTGGTRVLSDWLVVRVTRQPGRDLPRPHDRPGRGRQAPEDAQRDRARHPAGRRSRIIFLLVVRRRCCRSRSSACRPAGRATPITVTVLVALLVCLIPTTIGGAALGHRHRRHGPHDPGERHRHVGPRGRGGRRRRRAAARQDRHDHARQPPGGRSSCPPTGVDAERAGRRGAARLAGRRDARGPQHRRAGQGEVRPARARPARSSDATFVPFTRADPHERRRPRRPRRSARAPPTPSRRYVRGAGRRAARPTRRAAVDDDRAAGRHAAGRRRRTRACSASIHLKDIVKGGIKERFAELRRMGIKTVMITGDNPLTAAAIAAEAGVDDFLAAGHAGGQAGADPRVSGRRPPGGHDRRRHQRRAGAGPGRRGRGHEHRHAGGQGSRQHGRPRLATRPS